MANDLLIVLQSVTIVADRIRRVISLRESKQVSFRKFSCSMVVALAMTWSFAQPLLAAQEPAAEETLTIGSTAPPLEIEHWVQDGSGKYKPVTRFEPGKVYVIEFWATWCGPCIASMPHLAAMQEQYGERGVQIVSVSDEELSIVEKFLKKQVPDKENTTYRDLTAAYSLTTDPDGSAQQDYMSAAGQDQIPISFVVGKTGQIEWIGHPIELDDVLEAVVTDAWDRSVFAAKFKVKQEADKALNDAMELMDKRDYEAALAKIDQVLESDDTIQLQMFKMEALFAAKKAKPALEHVTSLYNKLEDDATLVNMVAWNVFELATAYKMMKPELIDASIKATEQASVRADKDAKGSILDTLAHYLDEKGELDKAIATEEKALELATAEDEEFMKSFLEQLREKKKQAAAKEGAK